MNLSISPEVTGYLINAKPCSFPVIEASNKILDPAQWLHENKLALEEIILNYGGVLLRNFDISSISDFNRFAQTFSPNLLEYIYRSTPRSKLENGIYSATEYPANQQIPLHNENSYSRSWPQKIFFFSMIVAAQGGSTPLANSKSVYQKIDPIIRHEFEKKGVLYVRNYRQGIDLCWQEVFQTDRKEIVESYCKNNGIEMTWKSGDHDLTTKQCCQATAIHPLTQETVWFNQAHLFHYSALDKDIYQFLLNEFGENNLPRNAYYGDGTLIATETLDHIREVYEQEKIKFNWQERDIMILDNLLMAHGRETYQGARKVAVAMS